MAKTVSKSSVKKEKVENKEKLNILLETPKKNRKKIDLEMKMRIIDLHKSGKSVVRIRKDLNLSQSTVSTILKDSQRIMEAVKSFASLKSTVITKRRTPIIEEMERVLVAWMEEQMHNRVSISLGTIQAKARSLFETLKENSNNPNEPTKFVASHGWFERFKKRHNLYNSEIAASSLNLQELGRLGEEQQHFLQEQLFHNANVDDLNDHAYVQGILNIDSQQLIDNSLLAEASKLEHIAIKTKKFTVGGLEKAFETLNKALGILGDMDSDERRFENIKCLVDKTVWCYKQVFTDLRGSEDINNQDISPNNHFKTTICDNL